MDAGATDLVGKGQKIVVYPYAVHRRQEQLGEDGQELSCALPPLAENLL